MSVPKARTNSAAQSQECCNEPERDCIWRNNTHTPTPPPSKLDQALLRDCTNYNYKYNHECSFPIIDDSTTNTPSTVLSSASTRSKSFEENLATITSMSTGAINNINVKEIANEPNLAIPNLSPRPGAIMSQSGDANRSRLSSQRDVNNNISAIVGPTINNSDGNSSSSSNINYSSDNNMNANSLHMHPFPNFGTQDKMHSLSHIHNASVSSLANDMKIQSQPSFGSAAFAATNAAISVTRPENTNTKTTDVNPKPPAQSQPLPHDQWNMSMNTNMNSMSISSAGQSVKSKNQSQSQPQVTGARLQPPSLLFQPQRQNQNASSAYPQLSSHSQSQKNVSERRQGTPSPSPLHNLTLPVLPAALTSYKNPIGAGSISAGSATGSTSISASASNSASFASKMQGKLMPNLAPAPHSPYQQSYQHQHSMSKSTTSGVGVNPRGRSTSMSDHSQHSHSHSHSHSNPHSHSHTHRPSPYPPKQPATSSWQHQHQHHSQHQSYRNSAHTTGKNAITGSPNSRPHSLHHQSSHHTSHSHSHSSHPHQSHQFQPSTGGSRSPPEVLKTLLRKKACLYEAGTSRAIALVTWLVGRNLALHQGYFSRQRLQAGVHAVVASKIDSGMITRTKVNRCMQIILNSCFHYIIPRPDGSEENGDAFCDMFRETVVDDVHLLKSLLPPWHDLDIAEAEKLMHQKDVDLSLSPKSSGSGNGSVATGSPSTVVTAAKGGGKKNKGSGSTSTTSHASYAESQAKRVVLLCFNENVRSAEDVLRCHNDFIRDAAISSNLHLTSDEWRYFFSRKDDDCSQTSGSHTLDSATSGGGIGAGTSPQMRGAEGGDIPYLSFDIPVEVSSSMDFEDSMASDSKTKCNDVLGQMCSNEICKFRTSWCCKRYDHDTRLCKFAHVGENKGWLRRDPNVYSYSDKLCPYTTVIKSDDPSFDPSLNGCHVNGCKDGLLCKFAHSQEEVDYHPKRYKTKLCEAAKANSYSRPCTLLDICPLSHPSYPGHHQRSGRRRNNSFSSRKGGDVKHNSQPDGDGSDKYHAPPGAPMLYLSPAPMSDFEKSFQFPGLQSLFRRNSTVHYANCLGKEGTKFCLFGDTCGLKDPLFQLAHGGTNSFSLYSE